MSKLDEIQARAKNAMYVGIVDNYLCGQDVALLIRAVRQFSNLSVHMTGRAKALKEGLLDPDVLELIGGEE